MPVSLPTLRRFGSIAAFIGTLVLVGTLFGTALAGAQPVTRALRTDVGIIGTNSPVLRFHVVTVLPDDAPLPAQIPVAVPAGAEIRWVGELDDTQGSNDTTTTYTLLETRGEYDIYLADLTQSRMVQFETSVTGSFLTSTGADTGFASFSYTPAIDVDMLTMGVEAPLEMTMENQVGYSSLGLGIDGMVYGTTIAPATAGETYTMQYTFSRAAAQQGSTDNFTAILIVLAVALVALLIALFAIIARQRGSGSGASGGDAASGSASVKAGASANTPPKKPAPKHHAPKQASAQGKHTPKKSSGKFSFTSPQGIIVIVIVVIGVIAFTLAAYAYSNNISFINGVYSQEFGGGDPCAEIPFQLNEQAMADPEYAARSIFRTLRDSNLVLVSASLDTNLDILVVLYCASMADEMAIISLVESTGFVQGAAQPLNSILASPTVETKNP
ncbi:MAG: hypothetical protein FWG78_02685 [Coriobacteriia bacterium]|nr:hypothetical protein [Coriobacteriia bacterium]